MKNFDVKKLIIAVVVIVLIILLVVLLGKNGKDNSVSKKDIENYQPLIVDYYTKLTEGANTPYNGIELLYTYDEIKTKDLTPKQLIATAIRYINLTKSATDMDLESIKVHYGTQYPDVLTARLYNASDIRKALKELFDIDEFSNQTTESEFTSPTAYTYLAEADIYIVTTNTDYTSYVSDKQFMDFSTISTEAKDEKIVSTVAVAYCYQDNDGTSCATDKEGTNIVAKNVDGFPKDHIDNFDKFEFTMKKSKDGKSFVFESVKKVK